MPFVASRPCYPISICLEYNHKCGAVQFVALAECHANDACIYSQRSHGVLRALNEDQEPNTPRENRVGTFVSDFDGTLTQHDFFRRAFESLMPPGVPDYWHDYLAGRLTHFEAMRLYYSAIRASEADTLAVVESLNLAPHLAEWVQRLNQKGWRTVVASAGCEWYIRYLLQRQGVDVEVHANPGRFLAGQGLLMELPMASQYFSPTHGIDKAALVRAAVQSSQRVAFAGDGYPDGPAARLVDPELRFATGALAETLEYEGMPFRRFDHWVEVAQALIGE
jgi:2-hydroxy-3-keto-5-methylthiopentenyl-1-phosphate phosphatase